LTAAIGQEGIRDKIFDTAVITSLGSALANEDYRVRASAVEFLTAAIGQEGIRDKIFDTALITELKHRLNYGIHNSQNSTIKFLTAAIAHEGIRDQIFNAVNFAPMLQLTFSNEFWSSDYVCSRVYNYFITSALCEQLKSASSVAQTRYFLSEAVNYDDVHTRICTEELRKIFSCPHHDHLSST